MLYIVVLYENPKTLTILDNQDNGKLKQFFWSGLEGVRGTILGT
jgi:hypothetical protein